MTLTIDIYFAAICVACWAALWGVYSVREG